MKTLSIILSLIVSTTALSQEVLYRRTWLAKNFSTKNRLVKVAFFDADSTLRVSLSGSVSANGDKDVMLLPFVSRRIAELNEKGYLIMIVSNQGGVAKGLLPIETADKALKYTADLIKVENAAATIHFIDFAEQEDSFRKPLTGMAVNLSLALAKKNLKIDWTQSFMVGDSAYKKGDLRPDGQPGTHFSNSDRLFAENLNIPFYEPNKFFGWKCHGIDVFDKAEQVTNYLRENPDRCEVLAGPIKKPSHEGRLMN